ncbi:MAG: ectoine hydroxylase [Acidimicrobiales bacterium]
MTTVVDAYPSRVANEPSVTERREPIIHHPAGTASPGPASHEALVEFERDGYMVMESLFSPDEMDACLDELNALSRDPEVRRRPETITEPDADAVRSVFAVHRTNQLFAELGRDRRLVEIAEQILGSDVYIHQSRVNLKPGLTGQPFFWHSDFETWHVEDGMPRMRAVSASVALTDNTEFNGPLMLIPGSHRWFVSCVGETPERHYETSLRRQEIGTPDADTLSWMVNQGGIVAPKAKRGSVIFFECNTLHASGVNLAPAPRSNAFFVYNSVENEIGQPFGPVDPRPEYLASRETITTLR